jgi:ligand-binding SRPBCC domain-containing protein
MHNVLTILYEIKIPLFGRKRWLTEIKHIREGVSFVDEQRIGPYKLWYHYHEIESIDATHTRMLDRVHYRLPLEPFSLPVHELWVKKMLSDIFDYRSAKLTEIFPQLTMTK